MCWQDKQTQLFQPPLTSQVSTVILVTLLCTSPSLWASLSQTGGKCPTHLAIDHSVMVCLMDLWFFRSQPWLSCPLLLVHGCAGDSQPCSFRFVHGVCLTAKETPTQGMSRSIWETPELYEILRACKADFSVGQGREGGEEGAELLPVASSDGKRLTEHKELWYNSFSS